MIASAQTHSQKTTLEGIRAITFDVQGTCVDFLQPILRMGETVNRHKGLDIDWAALSFDSILTAELARSYKPAPAVYQLAVDYLGCRPHEILMVACHKYDLTAAGIRDADGVRSAPTGARLWRNTGHHSRDLVRSVFGQLRRAGGRLGRVTPHPSPLR
jgi:phosphoglycolate phosphatase-like HAD superfamily hydrolase